MSRYTTEFHYLFDNFTDENIFGLYPIFDENYRETLNQKIKEYYFFDEIGSKPPGRFCQRMKAKMLTIMPYYNQLYKSQLAEINPFITKRYGYTMNTLLNRILDEKSKNNRDLVDILNDIMMNSSIGVNDTVTSNVDDTVSKVSDIKDTNNVDISFDKTSGIKSDSKETLAKDRSTETFNDVKDTFNYNNERETFRYENENKSTTFNNIIEKNTETGAIQHEDSVVHTKNTKSVTSDAPEGLVKLDTLENNLYANQATIAREVDTPKGSTTDTFQNHVNENVKNGNENEMFSGGHLTGKEGGHNNTKSGSIVNDHEYEKATKDSTNLETDKTENFSGSEKNKSTNTNTNIFNGDVKNKTRDQSDQTNDRTDIVNEIITAIKKSIETQDSNSDYQTLGFDSTTMSEMLTKWRETFLNIDMMIINELEDMFMLLLN